MGKKQVLLLTLYSFFNVLLACTAVCLREKNIDQKNKATLLFYIIEVDATKVFKSSSCGEDIVFKDLL